MLRITNTDTPAAQRWTFSGELVGPWAAELMTDWQRACVGSPGMLFGFPPQWCSASPECAPEQIIEILLGVAVKTISNYFGSHLGDSRRTRRSVVGCQMNNRANRVVAKEYDYCSKERQ